MGQQWCWKSLPGQTCFISRPLVRPYNHKNCVLYRFMGCVCVYIFSVGFRLQLFYWMIGGKHRWRNRYCKYTAIYAPAMICENKTGSPKLPHARQELQRYLGHRSVWALALPGSAWPDRSSSFCSKESILIFSTQEWSQTYENNKVRWKRVILQNWFAGELVTLVTFCNLVHCVGVQGVAVPCRPHRANCADWAGPSWPQLDATLRRGTTSQEMTRTWTTHVIWCSSCETYTTITSWVPLLWRKPRISWNTYNQNKFPKFPSTSMISVTQAEVQAEDALSRWLPLTHRSMRIHRIHHLPDEGLSVVVVTVGTNGPGWLQKLIANSSSIWARTDTSPIASFKWDSDLAGHARARIDTK